MRVAIISDSHDNIANIENFLDWVKDNSIEAIIHCGDISSAETLTVIAQKFSSSIHLVFGNTDTEVRDFNLVAKKFPHVVIHDAIGEFDFENKTIGFTHYPWVADQLARIKKYDVVFYGHDHKPWEKYIGQTRLLNPGTLAGMFNKATFAVYDTSTNQAKLILLEKI